MIGFPSLKIYLTFNYCHTLVSNNPRLAGGNVSTSQRASHAGRRRSVDADAVCWADRVVRNGRAIFSALSFVGLSADLRTSRVPAGSASVYQSINYRTGMKLPG